MNVPKTDLEFKELAKKCQNGTATPEEQQAFDEAYSALSGRFKEWDVKLMGDEDNVKQRIFNQVKQNIFENGSHKRKIRFYKYAAVAVLMLSISTLYYFRSSKTEQHKNILTSNVLTDKQNYNKAYLTLSNGSKISLTDAKNGNILQEAGISISKTKDGQVVYQVLNTSTDPIRPTLNTISTPEGGQYMVILPDHTKAWLNTSSSITFPTAFIEKERQVSIVGEAYLEVSKDPNRLFKVKSGEAMISVLGTHFNIMNYEDEPNAQVTLLEGSVKLDLGESSKMIQPGQQAYFTRNSNRIGIRDVDTEDIIGWKNGYFQFDNTPLDEVMREIKRWYGVDIIYSGAKPNIAITAMISRSNNITKMLDLLKKSAGLDYEINNKQIIIKKTKGGAE